MSETKYKIGDTVRVRKDLDWDIDYPSGLIDEMLEYKGQLVKITDAWKDLNGNDEEYDCYLIEQDNGDYYWDNEMFEDEAKQDTEDNQPKICELLGFGIGEKFNIIGESYVESYNPYMITKNSCKEGESYYTIENVEEDEELDISALIDIINGYLHIEKYQEKIELTDRQKEIFKALKVLNINYMAIDDDGEVFGFKNIPVKNDDGCWHDDFDSTNIFLDDFQEELSPFIKKAKSTPFDISTLD